LGSAKVEISLSLPPTDRPSSTAHGRQPGAQGRTGREVERREEPTGDSLEKPAEISRSHRQVTNKILRTENATSGTEKKEGQ
jgi:hypothetical protein